MLEKLKAKREALVSELTNTKNEDLTPLYNERIEAYRLKAIDEVNAEHNAKIKAVEDKIGHYDFVIEALQADEIDNQDEGVEY